MKKFLFVILFTIFNLQVSAINCRDYYLLLANTIYNQVTLEELSSGIIAPVIIQQSENEFAEKALIFHYMDRDWTSKKAIRKNTRYTIKYFLTDTRNNECIFYDKENSQELRTNKKVSSLDEKNITIFMLRENSERDLVFMFKGVL